MLFSIQMFKVYKYYINAELDKKVSHSLVLHYSTMSGKNVMSLIRLIHVNIVRNKLQIQYN